MKRILLDANFLIDLLRFRIGIEELSSVLQEPHEFSILSATVIELKRMTRSSGKTGSLARLALEMIRLKKIKVIKVKEKSSDNAFLNMPDKNTIIATNDIDLRRRLKRLGIKTIYLRAKKHLAMG